MNNVLNDLISRYNPKTLEETKSTIKEIMQSLVLIGLSKTNFFQRASFYGGTALRIFYNLNRFSEDLDFTLLRKDDSFDLNEYISAIKETFDAYGIDVNISKKEKSYQTPIESAFAKVNTYETFISFKIDSSIIEHLHKDEIMKLKLEVDINPALGFKSVNKWLDNPEFAPISVLDEESLFAGKIHTILCRTYKNNVKGRDYYDYLFYIKNRVSPNIEYLQNKLIDSGRLKKDDPFDITILKQMLIDRFNSVDFIDVKNDTKRFLYNNEDISYYSKELFIDMTNKL